MSKKILILLLIVALVILIPGCTVSQQNRINTNKTRYTMPIAEKEMPESAVEPKLPPQKNQDKDSYSEILEHEVIRQPSGEKETWGFRVQIFSSFEKDEAEKIAENARNKLNEKVYVEFDPPYYKIRIGNIIDSEEAEALKTEIKSYGYSESLVVRTRIIIKDE